jgi:glycogen operon protein
MLNGKTLAITDEDGCPIVDDCFLFLVNAADEGVEFTLPEPPGRAPWVQILNTENIDDPFATEEPREKVIVGGRSMRVFRDRKE